MPIASRLAFLALCLPLPVHAQNGPQHELAPDERFAPRPVHRGRFAGLEDPRLAALRASGAVKWELDYGGFVLAGIDERAGGGAETLQASGIEWHDEQDRILFDGLVIDAARPRQTLARIDPSEVIGDPLDANLDPDAELYVVQFRGPARDEWLSELAAAGATVVQYVPWNSYVVRVAPREVALFGTLAAGRPEVQYLGVYEPAFRMSPRIRELGLTGPGGPQSVTVQLVEGPGADAAQRDLENLCTRVLPSLRVGPYRNVPCELDPVYFRWLAAHPGVFAIEERGTLHLNSGPASGPFDERQGQISAGNFSGAAPTAPGLSLIHI